VVGEAARRGEPPAGDQNLAGSWRPRPCPARAPGPSRVTLQVVVGGMAAAAGLRVDAALRQAVQVGSLWQCPPLAL
jgi:hypothetical protein